MKYPQLPQTPAGINPVLRQWLDAAAKMLRTYFGKGANGVPTRGELSSAGVVTVGGDGTITGPGKGGLGIVTVPPAVTGLTARGAMAAIYLSWDAPPFTNFANIVIMRSDTDDYGTAYAVGSAIKGVTGYVDNVGSGATKYYWVYAVTTSGVNGPPNAVHGTRGHTGYDPSYVMSILTSYLWVANTGYEPYQYVRPTTANGFQYVCVDGGTSGATEPTWPVVIGNTVIDGTCEWKCEEMTARVPFAIGTVDGMPAVTILNAFIEDASITTAQIKDLAADKITAGKIQANVDINLKGYLWNGFSAFENTLDVPGFWFGMDGSTPKLKLTTGAPGGDKGLTFDGSNMTITGDGTFDDVFGHNAGFDYLSAGYISYINMVIPSDFIADHHITLDNPVYNEYLCATTEVFKTATAGIRDYGRWWHTHIAGTQIIAVEDVNAGNYTTTLDTGYAQGILPYDFALLGNVSRYKRKGCSYIVMLAGEFVRIRSELSGPYSPYGIFRDTVSSYIDIHNGDSSVVIRIDLKAQMGSVFSATETSPHVFPASCVVGSGTVSVSAFLKSGTQPEAVFVIEDYTNVINFTQATGAKLKAKFYLEPLYIQNVMDGYLHDYTGNNSLYIQLWKPQYTPASSVPSDARLY